MVAVKGSARAVACCFSQDHFRILWPGFLLQAAREGKGGCPVTVSLSLHTGPLTPDGVWAWWDRSVTRVSWWMRIWRGLLPWQEGLQERKRGWSPLEEHPSLLVSRGCPRRSSAPGLVLCWLLGAFSSFGCPSAKSHMKRSRNLAGTLGEEQPLPTQASTRGLQWPAQPQNEVRDPPKQSSAEHPPPDAPPRRGAAAGLQNHPPPGKEHGPASGDGQNLSLSSTLSPGGAPKAAGVWGSCCPSRGPRPAPRGSGQSRECASGSLKG